MSLQVNNPGDHRQVSVTLANEYVQTQHEQYTRCPKCDSASAHAGLRFGVVSGSTEYYGIIYHCACKDVFWVISPETGNKLEGG